MTRAELTINVIDKILTNFRKDIITMDKCICQLFEAMEVYKSETNSKHYADTDSIKECEEDDRK